MTHTPGTTSQSVPLVRLLDGREIPQVGVGVFQVPPEETADNVATALGIGYRHVDGAQMYRNEAEVGEGLRRSGLSRDEVWLTSKLGNGAHRPDDARAAVDRSLEQLGTDHLDLLLIHWPLPTRYDGDFVTTWRVLEELKEAGKARSIGVSNFEVAHLEALADAGTEAPVVNQVECHPYLANDEVRRYCREHGIVVEAWSPIAQGGVLDDPVVTDIAEAHGRSAAQVVLRWHVQEGHVVFPKSVTTSRLEENIALFDFSLDDDQMARISALDKGEDGRTGPHPEEFDHVG
ncbi:aldo/keto reductase [Aquipuribacter nitratireducens]|uniref:Aldo/keto reductase n=1 Tax=Aquipuribacter nitratireducens TaxID=650104 RepID=A0ABW0GSE1_9MICO